MIGLNEAKNDEKSIWYIIEIYILLSIWYSQACYDWSEWGQEPAGSPDLWQTWSLGSLQQVLFKDLFIYIVLFLSWQPATISLSRFIHLHCFVFIFLSWQPPTIYFFRICILFLYFFPFLCLFYCYCWPNWSSTWRLVKVKFLQMFSSILSGFSMNQ